MLLFVLYALLVLGLWLAIHHLAPALVLAILGVRNALLRLAGRRLDPIRARLEGRSETLRRLGPPLAIAVAGAALSLAAGDLFLDLAEALRNENAAVERADLAVHRLAAEARGESAAPFFVFFTFLGTPVGLGVLVAGFVVGLLAKGHPRWAAYLVLTTAVGGLINLAMKSHFARERPDLSAALRSASGFSFPSGHAMGATVVFGALSYLAFRALPSWKAKSGALALAVATILAISASRNYLGVHWITDVGAGIAAGTLWVVSITTAYEALRRLGSPPGGGQSSRAGDR
ncbi:MAG TPA: phosphatase PAP2 family protein [Thermoanaerobaculia bacterium]|nr:phosphatase PAP2 family protein [Thermoanaerobaculia bacterium]